MRIGFSGTQSGMTQFQKEELAKILLSQNCSEFIMGDCIGADKEAADIALECGVTVFTIFPPDNYKKRCFFGDPAQLTTYLRIITDYMNRVIIRNEVRYEVKIKWMPVEQYLERNKRIVDYVSLLIAAPKEHKHTVRSGTWSTIRYAWKTKRDEIIIPPIERPDDWDEELQKKSS